MVAQTAEGEVLQLSLFHPEASSPWEAWCDGKDSHGKAEESWGQPGTRKEELQMYHTATAGGGHSQPARGETEKQIYSRKPQAFYGQFPHEHMMKNVE